MDRVFPDIPVSKKPLEVRQGRGKGAVDYYAFNVKPGTIVFELSGVDEEAARYALSQQLQSYHLGLVY